MRDNENLMAADENISTVRQQLSEIIEDDKIADILGRECVDHLLEFRALVDKRCEEPFTLVILGEFKRGKSTIINALLGKKLAPINVTPETYTINEISFGHTQTVEAILENGQRVPLVLEDITRENLERRMKLFPAKISCVQIKDNAPILRNMRIVDTPGLSDLESLDKQVQDYIVNADAIMYAASCLLPFSETEQVFLATHVSPQRFGMLYVLVNMIDALNSMADVNKIMRRFRGISERIVPNAFVYGISGGDELKRKLGEERPVDKGTREFYETQFFQFELSLKRDIIMQKDVIRSKRVLTMLDQMHAEISSRLQMISDMAEMDNQLLEDKAREFGQQCDELAAELEKRKPVLHLSVLEMQQEAETWMYEFFAKLRTSILECRAKDDNGEDIYSPEDIEKYFYSFLMEKVGEAYRTCIECHRDAITELTDKMSRELAQALGIANIAEASKAPSVERLMMSANKNVTRSVMGVKLFGTSENFSPAAMSTFSLIMKKKKQTDIIDIALENYDEIRINIVKDIKTVYQDLEVKAISRLESLYQYQVELSRNALEQAKEMVNNEDKSELIATLSDALKRLEAPKKILDANLPA
ncbi:dynamin family protein [Ruminococcus sp.]|uniref:dynamin family protein n=1 Tax=Ruminococcus sp. TaxID=41978 RepID=UPI0025E5D992|nr:dynamin family protein [Ruminococcus sp.]MBQ8965694.1 dynamin family protein [Ruminococcus sp.]